MPIRVLAQIYEETFPEFQSRTDPLSEEPLLPASEAARPLGPSMSLSETLSEPSCEPLDGPHIAGRSENATSAAPVHSFLQNDLAFLKQRQAQRASDSQHLGGWVSSHGSCIG